MSNARSHCVKRRNFRGGAGRQFSWSRRRYAYRDSLPKNPECIGVSRGGRGVRFLGNFHFGRDLQNCETRNKIDFQSFRRVFAPVSADPRRSRALRTQKLSGAWVPPAALGAAKNNPGVFGNCRKLSFAVFFGRNPLTESDGQSTKCPLTPPIFTIRRGRESGLPG